MNSSYSLKQKWKLDSPRFASAMLGPSSLLATLVLVQPSDAYSTDSRLDDKHITHVVVFYTWLSYTLHLFLRKKTEEYPPTASVLQVFYFTPSPLHPWRFLRCSTTEAAIIYQRSRHVSGSSGHSCLSRDGAVICCHGSNVRVYFLAR